jgi:hypothetical protein
MKRNGVRERVTISYLEHRVQRAEAAMRKARSSRIKGVLPAAQRAYRIAVARLAAARPTTFKRAA